MDLPASNERGINFSKSMSQLLGSLGNLNEKVMDGFSIVAAYSDNWRQSMRANLTGWDNRLSRLEESLGVMRSSLRKTQDECTRLSLAQCRAN